MNDTPTEWTAEQKAAFARANDWKQADTGSSNGSEAGAVYPRIAKYCLGLGLDLGCELDPVQGATVLVDAQHKVHDFFSGPFEVHIRNIDSGFPDWERGGKSFDFIFSSHLLEHVFDPHEHLAMCWRLLRPGGNLIVVGPDEDWYWPRTHPNANPDHKWWDLSAAKVTKWMSRASGGSAICKMQEDGTGLDLGQWSFVCVYQKPEDAEEIIAAPPVKKLSLPSVTLMAYVTGEHNRLYKAVIERTQNLIDFGQTVVLTDDPSQFPSASCIVIPTFTDYKLRSVWAMTEFPKIDFFGETTHFLGVHHDGFPLRPDLWQDRFLDYDYIGSVFDNGVVGNNGFCMMSKRFMQAVRSLNLEPVIEACFPDDVLMSMDAFNHEGTDLKGYRTRLENLGMVFAPPEIADQFSHHYGGYTGQFGFHGIDAMRSARAQGVLESGFLPELAQL